MTVNSKKKKQAKREKLKKKTTGVFVQFKAVGENVTGIHKTR